MEMAGVERLVTVITFEVIEAEKIQKPASDAVLPFKSICCNPSERNAASVEPSTK